jgi:hypothetical protein
MYELLTSYQPQAIIERGQRAVTAITGKTEQPAVRNVVIHNEYNPPEAVNGDPVPEPEAEKPDFVAKYEHIDQGETDTGSHELTDEEERAALLGAIIPAFNHLPAKEKNQLRKEYGTDIAKLSLDELRNMDRDVKTAVQDYK